MYRDVIEQLGETIEAEVMVLSEPTMQANVEAVLAKAPPTFVLAGTSYGGSIALEVALFHARARLEGATDAEALRVAGKIGYPVVVKPHPRAVLPLALALG